MTSIYVDFQNLDTVGRVRLNTIGSIEDLNRQGTILEAGLVVRLYGDEFEVPGVVEFSPEEHTWAARFEWGRRVPIGEPDETGRDEGE